MKKIILAVIFLAAAGGGVYYLLEKKKNHSVSIRKELVTGKWKLDSLKAINDSVDKNNFALLLYAMDSAAHLRQYDFKTNGYIITTSTADPVPGNDSSSFSWEAGNKIRWQEKLSDTTGEIMTVLKLDKKDMVLRSSDSLLLYFSRAE
jgi:hypothetical protein